MTERTRVLLDLLRTPFARDRHCGWLAVEVERRVFGRDVTLTDLVLPDDPLARRTALAEHPDRVDWRPADRPRDGDIALIRYTDRPGDEEHVGVFLAPEGGIIHTIPRGGVRIDTAVELERLHGARLSFYTPI